MSEIRDVSDTALWVAAARAEEGKRPDALYRDDLAELLVGDRGREIAASMPMARIMGWVMAVRTVAIDRFILDAVARGVDTVMNLGAGLDTRPYRMASLPATLRWIEADFPHLIALKDEKLAGHAPVCRLERVAIDLGDGTKRRELFARIGRETKQALVITEGVISYLSNDDASALAQDLFAEPAFRYWIMDFYGDGGGKQRMPPGWKKRLRAAPLRFAPSSWLGFFHERGWTALDKVTTHDEAARIGRQPPFVFPWSLLFILMSKTKRIQAMRSSGYVIFRRT